MKKIIQSTKLLLLLIVIAVFSSCSIDDLLSHQITQYIAFRKAKPKTEAREVENATPINKMYFDIEQALKDGLTEEELSDYLSSTRKFNRKAALEAGYTHRQIIDFLAGKKKIAEAPMPGPKPPINREKLPKTGWKLSHKIVCKVYADKQDVVYWIEAYDGKERSPLYKMKKCIIADSDNWEGEMDYHSSFWPTRVEVVNGKLKFDGFELPKVGWWRWNFDEGSFRSSEIISTTWFVWNNNLVWVVSGIGILLIILFGWYSNIEDKKRERKEA